VTKAKSENGKLGYWEVTAIGVGGMVGGGIFAVLGLSVDLTRGGAPVAFFLAGIVALITSYSYAGATLLIANLVNLSSISTMGSAGFLLIFAAVNGANVILADETQSKGWLSLIGVGLCLSALAILLWQTAQSSPGQLWILLAMTAAALFIEITFRVATGRKISLSKGQNRDPR